MNEVNGTPVNKRDTDTTQSVREGEPTEAAVGFADEGMTALQDGAETPVSAASDEGGLNRVGLPDAPAAGGTQEPTAESSSASVREADSDAASEQNAETPIGHRDGAEGHTDGNETPHAPCSLPEAAEQVPPPPREPIPEDTATQDVQVRQLCAAYPACDWAQEMENRTFRDLITGTVRPTAKQVYEICHREELTAQAVNTAVAEAVRKTEEALLADIRARGLRPCENGMLTAGAVQTHPCVDRLTRSDRADLAKRAERGEHIRL